MPAADEVSRLQRGTDPECRLFQQIAEQGHYAGRIQPTSTRQGTYAAAPNGVLLASANTNDPKRMADMLRRALEKWNSMSKEQRVRQDDPRAWADQLQRPERLYPEGGLVLRVVVRDLPRDADGERPCRPSDWRAEAWNQDFAWFRRDEMLTLVPSDLSVGARGEMAAQVARRFARAHLIDTVRGQSPPYGENAVQRALLRTEALSVTEERVRLRITGEALVEEEGTWAIKGFQDMNSPELRKRGVDLKFLGFAEFDRTTRRFVAFDVVALGTRWGGTQYNARADDLAAAPIGFLLTLAEPTDRVAPANWWVYAWR
ncbi:MAG: hypothetical protein C4341_00565 [Armatimonadota bacterium]